MLEIVARVWLGICLLCAVGIAISEVRHPQRMRIMNVVWPVTALYLGVLAVAGYIGFMRKQDRQRGHDSGKSDLSLAQIAVAVSHCGAGCALADIVSEIAIEGADLKIAGSRFAASLVLDSIVAWLFGVAFQYFSIKPMRDISAPEALGEAIKADTASIASYQAGMFAWMAFAQFILFASVPPPATSATFWLSMQVGMAIGFVTAMPVNRILLRRGIKERMM